MTRPLSTVQPPSLHGTLVQHRDRIYDLEAPGPGTWVYVTPVAPAALPSDYLPDDPMAVPFQNGWFNSPTGQPCSFRLWPVTRVALRGDPVGGALGTVVFTLPEPYRPINASPITFQSLDGTAVFTGRVDPNGDVWILDTLSGDIAFDTNPQAGDWLFVETTTAGSPSGYGIELEASDGIFLHSTGAFIPIRLESGGDIALAATGFITLDTPSLIGLTSTAPGDSFGGIELAAASNNIVLTASTSTDPTLNGNLFLNGDGLTVMSENEDTGVDVGRDLTKYIPGVASGGRGRGTAVFEVTGDFRENVDTWEWDGAAPEWVQPLLANNLVFRDSLGTLYPGLSAGGAMGYDVGRGYTLWYEAFVANPHTWQYDGTTWTDLGLTTTHPRLSNSWMVYERVNNRLLMFGRLNTDNQIHQYFWTGTDWTEVGLPNASLFWQYAVVYDEAHGRTVVYGTSSDTWLFYSDAWHLVTPAHNPGSQNNCGIAWDANSNRVILVTRQSGSGFLETPGVWAWDGTDWTDLTTTITYAYRTPSGGLVSGPGVPKPLARSAPVLVWDGNQVMMFGGSVLINQYPTGAGALRDTWIWDGAARTFTFLQLNRLPPGREMRMLEQTGVAYDEARGRVVMYGGSSIDDTAVLVAGAQMQGNIGVTTDAVDCAILHLQQGSNIILDL